MLLKRNLKNCKL